MNATSLVEVKGMLFLTKRVAPELVGCWRIQIPHLPCSHVAWIVESSEMK